MDRIDVVPGLLDEFDSQFSQKLQSNKEYQALIKSLEDYNQAFDVAEISGNTAADVLNSLLTEDLMFDGSIPWNISDRVMEDVLGQLYQISNEAGMQAQTAINRNPALGRKTGLQVQPAVLDPDRVKGIKEMICSRTDIGSIHTGVREALPGYSLNTVSSVMEENAKMQTKAGMTPKIVRKLAPGCCDWCVAKAGTYDYSPSMDTEVFKKHKRCRCTVDYYPGDGRVQNSHTKKWLITNIPEKTGLKAGSYAASNATAHAKPQKIGNIDFSDTKAVETALKKYENEVRNLETETALVITKDGEVYKCFGTRGNVYPDADLGDKLIGSIISHNHPIDLTEYTFSNDDLDIFGKYKLQVLRGTDARYTYDLTRDSHKIDDVPDNWYTQETFRHSIIINHCHDLGYGYTRWEND